MAALPCGPSLSRSARHSIGMPVASLLMPILLAFSTSIAHAAVGRTTGSFQVNPAGGSSYHIPIFTPPGPGGVQPSIALTYSSNGGLGYLGRGWMLSGLSSISRCERTVAQDGVALPVFLSVLDPYCLDGNRLRYQGGGTYGTSGSTWATEIADFSRVSASGTVGNGVESWTVERKDGLTYTYGGTSDSRVTGVLGSITTVRAWLVSEISDRNGNKIRFTYKTPDSTTGGTTHPIKIEWTQTYSGSGSYVHSMDFAYAPGGNAPASAFSTYVATNEIKDQDLLTSITVSTSSSVVRKYLLTYESSPTTNAKRLEAVQECADSAGTDCFAATGITYQDGAIGYNIGTPLLGLAANITAVDGSYDFNGDGIKDIAYRQAGTWRIRVGSAGSGYDSEVDTGQSELRAGKVLGNRADQLLGLSGGTWQVYELTGYSLTPTSTGITSAASSADIVVADVDGDGRDDLIYITGLGTSTWIFNSHDIYPTMGLAVRRNTSTGGTLSFASPVNSAPLLHSLLPYGAYADTVPYDAILTSSLSQAVLSKGGDVNRDGRQELNVHYVYEWCLTYEFWEYWDGVWYPGGPCGGGEATGTIEANSSLAFWPEAPRDMYGNPIELLVTSDLNGDGCDDYLLTAGWSANAGAAQSSCSGAGTGIKLGATYWNDWDLHYRGAADWNGDGLKDPIFYNSTTNSMQVKPLLGSGSLGSATNLGISGDCDTLQYTDANGDGQDDISCLVSGSSLTVHARNSSQRADLAVQFQDGFGVRHSPTYAWTVGSHYTPYSNASYPYSDVIDGRTVVTQVEATDGAGGTFITAYAYHGGRTHLQGRGFAGFDKIETVDSRNGVKYLRRFAHEFPHSGMLVEEQLRQGDGTLMSAMTATPAAHTLDSASYNQRYFPYASAVTQDAYEVGGTRNGDWITRTEISNTYDTWGNLTASTRTVTDKDGASSQHGESWTQSSSASFSPSTTYWCLGLPTASSTTSSTTFSGESSVTISKSFTPDYVNCRMSQEILEPSNYPRRVETAYGYDGFGNLSSVAVTGYNPNSSAMGTRTSSVTWGSANGTSGGTGQFPVSETNALGQTTTRTFDPSFGSLLTETDPNGIVVATNEYDTFGRNTRSIRADGTATRTTYAACATYGCVNGDPSSGATGINQMIVITSERDTGDSQIADTWTYLDQFDRPIAGSTRTLSGSYNRTGRKYDALGRVSDELVPCLWSSCTVYWITNTYDLLGRLKTQSRRESEGSSTPVTTEFDYVGRTQTITDPMGKLSTKVLDVNGWLRRSEDHDGYAQLFGYDAAGSLKSVTDTASNPLFTATYNYGIKAFQTATTDMDLGSWSYTYNSLGELVSWTDAKSQSFSQSHDALTRVTERTEPDGAACFVWGSNAGQKNIGALEASWLGPCSQTTGHVYKESFTYDNIGRASTRTITTDQSYAIAYAYTNQGLLDTLTYPTSTSSTRVKVKYGYAYGILNSVTDWTSGSAGTVYWTADAKNVRGQTTQETLGNGVVTQRNFDAISGWLNWIQSGPSGGNPMGLQNLGYEYDLAGNVTQRQESTLGLTENFCYDDLHRLVEVQLGGSNCPSPNLTITYDAMGNITRRTDVNGNATWNYHGTKKHAVADTGTGGVSYSYDANGNMTSRAGETISWSSYNYPTGLSTGSESTSFYYGPDRQYYRQVYTGPASPTGYEETHYVGGILEKVDDGSVTDWRHYIRAEGQVVAIVSRPTSGSPAVHYPLGDNQGSGSHLTDSSGASVARQSYTAFGLPRDGSDWDGAVPGGDQTAIDGISRRGYTGHSMLGAMGLIHMNGRVQDAITGRFLSPDPTIPNPGFTQSYNRYAYVNNNPLSYIDPSGFSDEDNADCGDGAPCEELDGISVIGTVIRGCRVMMGGCDYFIAPSPWQLSGCIFTMACHTPEGGEEGVSQLGPLRLEHNAERLALKMKTLGRRDANGTAENQRGKPQEQKRSFVDKLKYGSCKIGNALTMTAKGGYDVGIGIQSVGAAGALAGVGAGGVGAAPGVATMAFGGLVSMASSAAQLVGGAFQYFSDSDTAKANMAAGGVSAASGGLAHGITGSFLRKGTNYVVRSHNLRMQARGGAAGVGVDMARSALPGWTPIQADCN